MLDNILLGLDTALTPITLGYCFLGVFLGTLVGVIPGIGPLTAISMLLPLTYHLDPATSLIMLAGIWYGTGYGGSTAAILVNIPGTTSSAISCLDGHPMALQGRGAAALFMTSIASFVGGMIGILLLMIFAPTIASYALSFGSAEYFTLMVLGLVAASAVSDGSVPKALAMVVLGILCGTVGIDLYTGDERLTFGILEMSNGIGLVPLAMGIFGIAEVVGNAQSGARRSFDQSSVSLRSMKLPRDEVKRSILPMLRGSGIGAFFGALPGTGPSVASFFAYALEKRISKTPERFGKGAIEGITAPEAANNAADQTAFVPTLTLGIPGSATMALMLGALTIHGIAPGPKLLTDQPALFWGLIMSFWVGNLMLLVLNIPMIGIWVKLLLVPNRFLYPAILMFIAIGTLSLHNNTFDVWLVIGFGLLGILMRWLAFPAAPLLLGFVLGPMMEEHFRRAMLLSRGDPATFVERPISATVLGLAVLMLVWGVVSHRKTRKRIEATVQT
ncbi:tripartite tricarboxylate transporter permease [Puniceibacterium sp. IMCC21224]|uniref:tripartite tricarboxylate transporter permease n=1 Tax=Puniceibacterium sp. IMCC21224 TaxID=1618204 RepID=UPI001E4A281A|nr:tripartite tricarboxylate transporter permease [Puniceibacterium sp. IMCC21224]